MRPPIIEQCLVPLPQAQGEGETVKEIIFHHANPYIVFHYRSPTEKINSIRGAMAPLDTILLLFFGFAAISGLATAAWCFHKALAVANEKDGDLKMFLWGLGTMIGMIVAGMSAAYILLPILFHY